MITLSIRTTVLSAIAIAVMSSVATYRATTNAAQEQGQELVRSLESATTQFTLQRIAILRAAENTLAERMQHSAAKLEKELTDAHQKSQSLTAQLHRGTVSMHVPVAKGSCRSSERASNATAASTASGDAAEIAELPAAVAAALTDLASDADDNTRQLAACQQVIRDTRAFMHAAQGGQ